MGHRFEQTFNCGAYIKTTFYIRVLKVNALQTPTGGCTFYTMSVIYKGGSG